MADDAPPIIIEGPEQGRVDPARADGGLPWLAGVKSVQVFRASKVLRPDDGRGWTYHHHVDMACWRGRLYVAWNSCERDEDVWPSHELYSTSADGQTWTDPAELFPIGVSTPLRMYFYHAPNGRMLAIAGLRTSLRPTDEDKKEGLVVREIRPDHSLGPCFVLQGAGGDSLARPLSETNDAAFLEACHTLRADRTFLEQQDRGRLLGDRRMKWHDPRAWPGGHVPGKNDKWVAGKAYSFYRRADGNLVGISKMGWTTTSADNGKTWTQPIVPPTLITGTAKVWGQRTRDGRYALVYNPSASQRYPLVVVSGDDGAHFAGMRVVQAELPIQRYQGLHRSPGPQYVRGISIWADDGSRQDERVMWLAYSMNKEDIWVSQVALPIDPASQGWHFYQPKWAALRQAGEGIDLRNSDPYDGPRATWVLGNQRKIGGTEFEVMPQRGRMEVEIAGMWGNRLGIRDLVAGDEDMTVGQWVKVRLSAAGHEAHRISFRIHMCDRGPTTQGPVDERTDRPAAEAQAFRLRGVRLI